MYFWFQYLPSRCQDCWVFSTVWPDCIQRDSSESSKGWLGQPPRILHLQGCVTCPEPARWWGLALEFNLQQWIISGFLSPPRARLETQLSHFGKQYQKSCQTVVCSLLCAFPTDLWHSPGHQTEKQRYSEPAQQRKFMPEPPLQLTGQEGNQC